MKYIKYFFLFLFFNLVFASFAFAAIPEGCENRDFNGDGEVTVSDQTIVLAKVGVRLGNPSYEPRFDLNNDGVISQSDVDLVSQCLPVADSPSNSGSSTPNIFNQIIDPLQGRFNSLGQIASMILPYVFVLGGMISLLFIIWGGFRYMTAQGDPKAIASARGTIVSAVIGLVLLASVFAIMKILEIVFRIKVLASASIVYAAQGVDIGCEFKLGDRCVRAVFPTLGTLLTSVITFALAAAGLVFFAMLLWGGMRYMLSRGDDKIIVESRQTLTNAVIGLLIVISSFAIIKLVSIATSANILVF
ncbi:MAG: dockerin type I domain-containing protein [Candidatus Woykebacteria bacterium]